MEGEGEGMHLCSQEHACACTPCNTFAELLRWDGIWRGSHGGDRTWPCSSRLQLGKRNSAPLDRVQRRATSPSRRADTCQHRWNAGRPSLARRVGPATEDPGEGRWNGCGMRGMSGRGAGRCNGWNGWGWGGEGRCNEWDGWGWGGEGRCNEWEGWRWVSCNRRAIEAAPLVPTSIPGSSLAAD